MIQQISRSAFAGRFFFWERHMDEMKEVVGLLYVALATAAGGRALLDDCNALLRDAVDSGAISRPNTRRAILSLVETTSRAA